MQEVGDDQRRATREREARSGYRSATAARSEKAAGALAEARNACAAP